MALEFPTRPRAAFRRLKRCRMSRLVIYRLIQKKSSRKTSRRSWLTQKYRPFPSSRPRVCCCWTGVDLQHRKKKCIFLCCLTLDNVAPANLLKRALVVPFNITSDAFKLGLICDMGAVQYCCVHVVTPSSSKNYHARDRDSQSLFRCWCLV